MKDIEAHARFGRELADPRGSLDLMAAAVADVDEK